MHAVALINPKFPHNVGTALRACSIFGASHLAWTGDRVGHPDSWSESVRLPREERMKLYKDVKMHLLTAPRVLRAAEFLSMTPVAVEKRDNAEALDDFVHPQRAIYVFGPEDGSLMRGMLEACHRFVCIPTVTEHSPLNLAAAVNVVLYDRLAKERSARTRSDISTPVGAYSQ